jgi:hypothetical protein
MPIVLSKESSEPKIKSYTPAPGYTAAETFAKDLFGDKTTIDAAKKAATSSTPPSTIYVSIHNAVEFLKSSGAISSMDVIFNVPRLLTALPLADQIALQNTVQLRETGEACANIRELVAEFEKSEFLKEYLATKKPTSTEAEWEPEQIEVNPVKGLSLIAANPLSASVIMEHRKAQNKLAEARLVRLVPSAFPVSLPYGVLAGGGNLDPLMPVDMRGAGPMIAAMRAGSSGGFALGTVGYPTQWRPVSDSTFISHQLAASLKQVTKALAAKGVTIDPDVEAKVKEVNAALKLAEENVKENRNVLNKFNNMLSSGDVLPENGKASLAEITNVVTKYNDNMKLKNKNEVKILRVLSVLASKLY